jgi:hypothetical protein
MIRSLVPRAIKSSVSLSGGYRVPQLRFFSQSFELPRQEPSLDEMSSFLSGSANKVLEVVSDEIVRIGVIEGVGIGSHVRVSTAFGDEAQGIVLQYNSKSATVALVGENRGVISRGASVTLNSDSGSRTKFQINRVPFNVADNTQEKRERISTSVPLVDMLLKDHLQAGSTIAIYSSSFQPAAVSFPSKKIISSSMELYLDLISQANAALRRVSSESTVFVCDLRRFEDACRSLEFQAGFPLPVNPQSLVSSVLQLAHTNDKGFSLSVIALFNSPSDFGNEASQSVDVGIELAGNHQVSNLGELIPRFALTKNPRTYIGHLLKRIVEGSKTSSELDQRKSMGIFADFWEQEERENFESLLRLLPVAAEKFESTTSIAEKRLLVRAMSILFFNKSPKLHSAAIAGFPNQLIEKFQLEEHELLERLETGSESDEDLMAAVDSALVKHRYCFELTNPLVVL